MIVSMKGNNLPLLKKRNEASIKEVIYKYGPISRSEIAEILSLTPPTITTNVAAMIQEGLIQECEEEDSPGQRHVGRKPINIDFVPTAKYVAGVELGPYHTSYCVLDLRGAVVCQFSEPAPSSHYNTMLEELCRGISRLWKESGVPTEKVLGAGVGLPGFIDGKEGVIRSNFRAGWNGRQFAHDLSSRIQMPVEIQNNVRARAIGAELFNPRISSDTFAYFFISHGIACPLVIKNSILSGETDGAGEVGHMVMEINGPLCETCGNHGCLDAIASERAIRRRVQKALQAGLCTIIGSFCKDPGNPHMEEILKAQEAGDRVVSAIISDAVTHLGVALANIINLISPQFVLVDGYVMRLEENRTQLLEVTKKNMFGLNSQEVQILFEDYDRMSGARGAAAHAIRRLFIKL